MGTENRLPACLGQHCCGRNCGSHRLAKSIKAENALRKWRTDFLRMVQGRQNDCRIRKISIKQEIYVGQSQGQFHLKLRECEGKCLEAVSALGFRRMRKEEAMQSCIKTEKSSAIGYLRAIPLKHRIFSHPTEV